MSDRDTSRAMSHALRHAPGEYGLCLAGDGSVAIADLVTGLNRAGVSVDEEDVRRVVAESDKQRFAISGDSIRAHYGHSTAEKIVKANVVPPAELWHATSPDAAAVILVDGLRPMGRQYVHLTSDARLALQAGRRKAPVPVLLRVNGSAASAAGVKFSAGNDLVILADFVPAAHIAVVST